MGNLENCAGKITTSNADIIVDQDPGKPIDSTPLMDGSGHCGDHNPNDSHATEGSSRGDGHGNGSSPQSESPSRESSTPKSTGKPVVVSYQPACGWEGHCLGATCTDSNDCADPYPCVGGKCIDPS